MIDSIQVRPDDPDFLRILNARLTEIAAALDAAPVTTQVQAATPRVYGLKGTNAQRVATSAARYPSGTTWYETDRGLLYVSVDGVWKYVSGVYRVAFASMPSGLGSNDAGLELHDTTYFHKWRWNGTGWERLDEPAGTLLFSCHEAPHAGWVLADGSAGVTVTTATAGTTVVTLPNLVGAYAKGASGYTGTLVPASGGTVSGTTSTVADHSHGPGTLATGSAIGGTGQAGTSGGSLSQSTHTHNVSSGATALGGSHAHTFSGSVSSADVAHVDHPVYFRK